MRTGRPFAFSGNAPVIAMSTQIDGYARVVDVPAELLRDHQFVRATNSRVVTTVSNLTFGECMRGRGRRSRSRILDDLGAARLYTNRPRSVIYYSS